MDYEKIRNRMEQLGYYIKSSSVYDSKMRFSFSNEEDLFVFFKFENDRWKFKVAYHVVMYMGVRLETDWLPYPHSQFEKYISAVKHYIPKLKENPYEEI